MLQVILLILKVIGILLLVLLGLVLLILFLVLFCPIRYRFQADYRDKVTGQGWVRWMYPLLDVGISIRENKPEILIRIFGVSLDRIKAWMEQRKRRKIERKRQQRRRRKQKAKKKAMRKGTGAPPQKKSPPSPAKESRKVTGTSTETPQNTATPPPKEEATSPAIEQAAEPVEEKPKKSLRERIREFFRKMIDACRDRIRMIREKILALRDQIRSFKEKVVSLWGQWEEIRVILMQETTKGSLLLILEQLKRLLRHLKPRKLELWLHYGTGDPYTLGQHLTALAVIYGFLGEYIQVEPEWDEKVLEARGFIKGRIRLFALLRICLKVITHKDVKILWKQISERRQTNDGE